MPRQTIAAALLAGFAAIVCQPAGAGNNYYTALTFADNTGALSYSIFNLTPYPWAFTAYNSAANPYAVSGSVAAQCGWQGCEDPNTSGKTNPPSFFNYLPFDTPAGPKGNCDNTNPNQFPWVTGNPIFYNNMANPISKSKDADYTVQSGANYDHTIWAGQSNGQLNTPSMGDSWVLQPSDNTKGKPIMIATLAGSTGYLASQSRVDAVLPYPYCVSIQYIATLNHINPVAPPNMTSTAGETIYDTGNNILTSSYGNIFANWGAGFVTADKATNLNPDPGTDHARSGGLWYGVNNTATGGLAYNALNMPMYPVNFSNYVDTQSWSDYYGSASQCCRSWPYTPIYGAHMTLAVGDPYLVSSFAAKILWYVATSNKYQLQDASLSGGSNGDLVTLRDLVAPPDTNSNGVFYNDSKPWYYSKWLMRSPNLAGQAFYKLNDASTHRITKTSLAGKIVKKAIDGAAKLVVPGGSKMLGIANKGFGIETTKKVVDHVVKGDLSPMAQTAVMNLATKTISPPPAQASNAPPVYNSTYSSTDLLGLLLNNAIVQAEVNYQLGIGNTSGKALYSNYPIMTDSICDTNSLALGLNNIGGNCYKVDSSGKPTTTTVATGGSGSARTYTNVLSTYANSSDTHRINLWGAILTGSDVTTDQDYNSPTNGAMQLANPSQPSFTPPTQLVDATGAGDTPGTSGSVVFGVDTAFDLSSGLASVASYTFNSKLASASSPAPTTAPQVNLVVRTGPLGAANITYAAPNFSTSSTTTGSWSYASNGTVTINGYWGGITNSDGTTNMQAYSFATGNLTLDMTTCAPDSDVLIMLDGDQSSTNTTASNASGSVYCSKTVAYTASSTPTATQPAVARVIATPPASDVLFPALASTDFQWNSSSGILSYPGGYKYSYNSAAGTGTFVNSPLDSSGNHTNTLSIDTTKCAAGSAVTLTIYPIGTNGSSAYGFLTCQSPASLPYGACTSDQLATGGMVVAISSAPDALGNGASFKLGCNCVPDYLGGSQDPTTKNKLGGVTVGATSAAPDQQCPQS